MHTVARCEEVLPKAVGMHARTHASTHDSTHARMHARTTAQQHARAHARAHARTKRVARMHAHRVALCEEVFPKAVCHGLEVLLARLALEEVEYPSADRSQRVEPLLVT